METLTFESVNFDNVAEFLKLQRAIFPESDYDATLYALAACDKALFEKTSGIHVPFANMAYYLAMVNGEFVGISGLYTYGETGAAGECWLGWYGVDKQYRGKGFGKNILDWTTQNAVADGYEVLRLYTTPKKFRTAASLYEKEGFIAEDYTLEYEGITIYSKPLTNKPLELVGERFINFAAEVNMSEVSSERKTRIFNEMTLFRK